MEALMATEQALRNEVLTRLLHAHPAGLGKEVLDNYRGQQAVVDCLADLQQRGLIQGGSIMPGAVNDHSLDLPIKLTSAGVEQAKSIE